MTLPGFTAQHSLYRSTAIYRSYSSRDQSASFLAEDDVIEPAFVCNPAKLQSCMLDNQIPYSIREVVCVRQYGDCSFFNGLECSGSGELAQCVSSGYVNCGGVACPLGAQACCDDVCCAVGEICCGGPCCSPESCCGGSTCVDLTSDHEYCGNCHTSCGPTQCCIDGTCTTNTKSDPNNCGTCGHVCPTGTNCCNGICCNLASDNNNCGSCGNICTVAQSDYSTVGPTCCDGQCSNLQVDPNNCGSCGTVCPNEYTCFFGCCVDEAPILVSDSSDYYGNTNYWISDKQNCRNIPGLTVTFETDNDGTTATNGFSLQLNAVPPPNNNQVTWMQYVFVIDGSNVETWVEYWNIDSSNNCIMFSNNNISGSGSSCCGNGNCCNWWDSFWQGLFGGGCDTPSVSLTTSNGFQPGTFLSITLNADGNGNITEAVFEIDGQWSSTVPIPGNLQVPIQSFQYVLVGEDGGASTEFLSIGGTITYQAAYGHQLCVQGAHNSCPSYNIYPGFTAELSNATYGNMSKCCGGTLQQTTDIL
jgi:Stigma-specific protein, Stig1